MPNYHCRPCREGEEAGNCSYHGDLGFQQEVRGAEVEVLGFPLCYGQNGRSRCLDALCCGPSAARPSFSSPWPPAGSCRRTRPGLRGRCRVPDPEDRLGYDCGGPGSRPHGRSRHGGDRGSSRGAGGRRGRGRILFHCCSIHRPN